MTRVFAIIATAFIAVMTDSGAFVSPARAAIVFDSQQQSLPFCGTGSCIDESYAGGSNFGAVLGFTRDFTASKFGMFSSVDDAQEIKFVIFDSVLGGGNGNLLFSQTKSFPSTAQKFIYTDPIHFTFRAGHTYDIGIIGDGNSITGRWLGDQSVNLNFGGVTQLASNAIFESFSAPQTSPNGYGGITPFIQLTESEISPIPEPSTWALLLGGFAGLGCVGFRSRTITKRSASAG